jgi:hypothetical protein
VQHEHPSDVLDAGEQKVRRGRVASTSHFDLKTRRRVAVREVVVVDREDGLEPLG